MEYNYWLPITSYCLNCGWIITSCGCVILTWGQIWQVVKEEGIHPYPEPRDAGDKHVRFLVRYGISVGSGKLPEMDGESGYATRVTDNR
jgi:hypothetical protein